MSCLRRRLSGWVKISEFPQDASSQQVISALRQYFVDTGVPVRIRTDGGPQSASSKYRQFMKRWGMIPVLSTPHYPQSNGHAEAAVKAMKSLLATTTESGNIDSEEFCEGLLEWLNTPKAHSPKFYTRHGQSTARGPNSARRSFYSGPPGFTQT